MQKMSIMSNKEYKSNVKSAILDLKSNNTFKQIKGGFDLLTLTELTDDKDYCNKFLSILSESPDIISLCIDRAKSSYPLKLRTDVMAVLQNIANAEGLAVDALLAEEVHLMEITMEIGILRDMESIPLRQHLFGMWSNILYTKQRDPTLPFTQHWYRVSKLVDICVNSIRDDHIDVVWLVLSIFMYLATQSINTSSQLLQNFHLITLLVARLENPNCGGGGLGNNNHDGEDDHYPSQQVDEEEFVGRIRDMILKILILITRYTNEMMSVKGAHSRRIKAIIEKVDRLIPVVRQFATIPIEPSMSGRSILLRRRANDLLINLNVEDAEPKVLGGHVGGTMREIRNKIKRQKAINGYESAFVSDNDEEEDGSDGDETINLVFFLFKEHA
jgi:hypothetical protein